MIYRLEPGSAEAEKVEQTDDGRRRTEDGGPGFVVELRRGLRYATRGSGGFCVDRGMISV